ncbi:Crp/Fnr family transcriptional regulator [Falsiroseomonas sp. CW058]|uniref:Crp/Fnr family transcriptional regulator n=1 Tax=Falsiroseomonas sp. CW058 TaxID=3388664 RepID=UPI003D30F544
MNPLDAARRLTREALGEGQVCTTCGSRVAGLCRPLDAAALDEVVAETEQIAFAARDTLFDEGDRAGHVFTLVTGTAKLTRLLADGREQVLGFRFAGDVLGYTVGETYPFAAQLLTPAQVCRLERRRLETLLRRYPALERRFLDLCVQELAATQEQLVSVGRRTAEGRVAAFLLSLVEAGRRRGAVGGVLDMPMTRGDIADFLGLTLETVSRTLTAFRRRGWIREPSHGRMELLRSDQLTALAEGSPAE